MLWVAGGNPRPPALSDNPATPYPRAAFRLSCVNLNCKFDFYTFLGGSRRCWLRELTVIKCTEINLCCGLKLIIKSTYHLHRNFGERYLSNSIGIFLAPKTGTGLCCTIYKIPVNVSLSLDMKPGTSNPNKMVQKILVILVKTGKR